MDSEEPRDVDALLEFLFRLGQAYIGCGEQTAQVELILRRIAAANPDALLFGTDLPSTRAARPFAVADVQLLKDALDRTEAARALWSNALRLYRPRVQEVA